MKLNMKLSLLSVALLGLAACGSGGGASGEPSGSTVSQPTKAENNSSPKETHPPVSPISNALKQEVKKVKKIATVTESINDIPVTESKFIILGKDFGQNWVELDLFPSFKLVQENWSESFKSGGEQYIGKGIWRVYNQIYSGLFGYVETEEINISNQAMTVTDPLRYFEVEDIVGLSATKLPVAGSVIYKGVAFDYSQQGKLSYQVNFANKEGYGEITGLERFGKITLEKAPISHLSKNSEYADLFFANPQLGIVGKAKAESVPILTSKVGGNTVEFEDIVQGYYLQFFGPNAEEIGGLVKVQEQVGNHYRDRAKVGFAGTKQ